MSAYDRPTPAERRAIRKALRGESKPTGKLRLIETSEVLHEGAYPLLRWMQKNKYSHLKTIITS